MSTDANLKEAFAGESQASRKYMAFAKVADDEGYPGIAKLFRAAADAETVHSRLHLANMGGIGTTEQNLRAAIAGENYEHTEMYPPFIEEAKAEGRKDARLGFHYANEVEKIHDDMYTQVLSGMSREDATYYVCQNCGNTVENEAPEKCPVCGHPKEQFKLIV